MAMKKAEDMTVDELRVAYARIAEQKARRKAKLTPAQLEKRRTYGKQYRSNRAAIEARAEQLLAREQALHAPVVSIEPMPAKPAPKPPKK